MKRRSFLEQFGLLASGLVVSLQASGFDKLKHSGLLQGRVTDGRKGIANAIISDGFEVVATDTQGRYSIQLHDKAEFVFLSTPSGYDFTSDASWLSQQHQKLGARNQIDFTLKKLKVNDSQHHFIIWADPQVKNNSDVAQMMDTAVPDVKQLVRELGKNALVHGIGVGDLVWDNHKLFPAYSKAVQQMGIPFFQCLGNHDQDYRLGGDETSDKTFKSFFGPTYYSFNRGKAHYVVLDDVRYLGVDRKYDGYISQQQLDWLQKDLSFVPKDHLIIISVHIPVHNSVKNNNQLYDLLKDFPKVHIMSGHTHYNKNVIQNGVYEHNHGTVCGAWWTGPICGDGTPRGYGVYTVNNGELSWYYKSTGLNKSKQVSIDVENLTANKRIVVNVWNHDPQWKVQCFLDGQACTLEPLKGFDPEAVRLYKGDKLPVERPFAEPKRTEHLFLAHCSAAVHEVKVVATDPFGQQFTETKKIS